MGSHMWRWQVAACRWVSSRRRHVGSFSRWQHEPEGAFSLLMFASYRVFSRFALPRATTLLDGSCCRILCNNDESREAFCVLLIFVYSLFLFLHLSGLVETRACRTLLCIFHIQFDEPRR